MLALVGLAAAVSFVAPARAGASASGGAWTNGDEVGAGAHDGGDGGGGGHHGASHETCTWERLSDEETQVAVGMWQIGFVHPGDGPGAWYRESCTSDDGSFRASIVWLADRVDPAALATSAFDVESIPLPDIHLNPPNDNDQVVNVETWLWLGGWLPVSASATAGPITVTVTAAPQYVDWDMGDGTVVRCDGPGTPYDSSRAPDEQHTDCAHTYQRSSASQPDGRYRILATSYWHVTWAASDGSSGDFGIVPRRNVITIRVAEIQAVNG